MESFREMLEKNFVPVGATFLVGGVEYVVQEADSCIECACCNSEAGYLDCIGAPKFPLCSALLRKDNKDVIFKRV